MHKRLVWGGALMLSLGANVVLWWTRPAASPAHPVASRGTGRELKPPPPAPVTARYSRLDRATLEQKLVETEARVDQLLTPEDKFAAGDRSTEAEAAAKPYLDKVFAPLSGADPKYRVECHGRVCKVESDISQAEWMEPLQQLYPGREMFSAMEFARLDTYVELAEEPVDGAAVREGIFREADPAISACIDPAMVGVLVIHLSLDLGARRILVTTEGSLADQPVGRCIRTALEDTVARGVVPPTLTSLPADPVEVTLPRPPAAR